MSSGSRVPFFLSTDLWEGKFRGTRVKEEIIVRESYTFHEVCMIGSIVGVLPP